MTGTAILTAIGAAIGVAAALSATADGHHVVALIAAFVAGGNASLTVLLATRRLGRP